MNMTPIDQMDAGLDLVKTARIALAADGFFDTDGIMAIAATLDRAIKDLGVLREHLNREQAAGIPVAKGGRTIA